MSFLGDAGSAIIFYQMIIMHSCIDDNECRAKKGPFITHYEKQIEVLSFVKSFFALHLLNNQHF